MANWCSNSIKFYQEDNGNDKLTLLYNDLKNYAEVKGVQNFAPNWIGHLLRAKGIDTDKYSTGAFIAYVDMDKSTVTLDLNTKWTPLNDIYNLISKIYQLEYVYIAEEWGCGVFVNTDTEGRYFSDRYIVIGSDDTPKGHPYYNIIEKFSDIVYYGTIEELLEDFSSVGIEADNFGDLVSKIEALELELRMHKFSEN